jgi:hypothetical protein
MKLNHSILGVLKTLSNLNHIKKNLSFKADSAVLKSGNVPLVKIDSKSILVNDVDIEKHILTPKNSSDKLSRFKNFNSFIKEVGGAIIRINHFGVGYFCKNVRAELRKYRKAIAGTRFKIYEEDSGDPKDRWFFIGDASDFEEPLFEICLSEEGPGKKYSFWPYFQIDLDVDLLIEEIEELTTKYFGSDFLELKFNVPGIGVVLATGKLATINGTNFALAIGTKTRDIKYHRKVLLRPIKF